MTVTILADLVGELSIKSGLSKNEIRRWVMALQKNHPSHPTVEKAAIMIASVFGIPKESSESTIENQQTLNFFPEVSEPKNGTDREKSGKFSAKDSKSRIKSSESLVNVAEEEIQRLARFLSFLEKTASRPH